MDKCGNGHKLGNYMFSDDRKSIYRACLCCGKKSSYPLTKEFVKQIEKQDTASKFVSTLIEQDPNIIKDSDDVVRLSGNLMDYMYYIDVSDDNHNSIVSSIDKLNGREEFFVDRGRYELLGNVSDCFSMFFKKEELEIACGLDNFPDVETKNYYEELVCSFDILYDEIENNFDKIFNDLYEQHNSKESPKKK